MKKYLLCLLVQAFALCLPCHTTAQIITTIAGGSPGYSGDGGPASAAQLNQPDGISVDVHNNVYISDWGNACVRKISPSGIITTVAGVGTAGYGGDGGPATAAHLANVGGAVADASGNIYITDETNNRIRKVNAAGYISTIAGTGTPGFGGDGGQATAANIYLPYGIVIDGSGNIIFADRNNHRVRMIDTFGIISTIAGDGAPAFTGDGVAATTTGVSQPNYVCVNSSGKVFISDNGNQRIRTITAGGIIQTIAGTGVIGSLGDGSPATAAQLQWPAGIKTDAAGNFYIADAFNYKIRKIDGAGIIRTIAGTGGAGFGGDGGPATAAQLKPYDIALISGGNILVADFINNRIRLINYGNHAPFATSGIAQNLAVCRNSLPVSVDTILAVTDTDVWQTETWSLTTPPAHGTAIAGYSTYSTGGVVIPSGLTYVPATGYSGSDMFKVTVTDGTASVMITVNVTIDTLPNPGIISGIDSVCPGASVTLSESVTGGVWSSSNSTISSISAAGTVAGLTPGMDSILYTVTNVCGSTTALHWFKVRPYASCPTETAIVTGAQGDHIQAFPNPGSGLFTISLVSMQNSRCRFLVRNIMGRDVMKFAGNTNEAIAIKLNQPPGVYFLVAETDSGNFEKKIVIQ